MVNPNAEVHVPEINEREVFVGPRPFERSEQNLFFGRDREISELLSLVTSNRVVLCYAPSGAGKTSLINAGLHPRLEKEGFEVLPSTRVRGLIPEGVDQTAIANIYIFNAILSLSKETKEVSELAHTTLAEFLSTVPHLTDQEDFPSPRILIFDQFEELLTSYLERWQERDGFFQQVYDALQKDPLLRVLFVMREDYVARIEPFMRMLKPLQQTRFRLDLLGPSGAQAAVTGPLRDTQRRFKDGVVAALIEELLKVRVESTQGEITEVVGEYVEPVQLQVVCRTLWNSLPDDVQEISHEHLKAYGDVDQALRDFYESCISDAKTSLHANEKLLREWFERQLITPAGTRGIVFRDAQHTAGLPNAVVDLQENKHVIRGELRAGSRWYELTHDRLIEPIQRANERWRAQRQANRNRTLVWAGGAIFLFWAVLFLALSLRPTSSSAPQTAYTQSASTVVAVQTVAQEQVEVAQENVAISQSRQLSAQALLSDDPQLARLLAVQANRFYDTPESRRTLHKILSSQSIIDDRFLRAFNSELISPTLVTLLEDQGKGITSVAFSPDGKRFVSASADNTLILWDSATTKPVLSLLTGHRSSILTVTFSPDGKRIASAGLDGQIILWDTANGQRIGNPLVGNSGVVLSVAFSPDSKRLAAGEGNASIQVWDVDTQQPLKKMFQRTTVWSVAWSPDGKYLAAGDEASTVRVWDAETYGEVYTMNGHRGAVQTVAWSPDAKMIASGSVFETDPTTGAEVGEVIVWSAETGKEIARPLRNQYAPVSIRSVAFDPRGKFLAIGRGDYSIILWDTQSEEVLGSPLNAHRGAVRSMAFSPDGRYLISAGFDKKLALWDIHPPVKNMAISPTGTLLASSQGNAISLWDLSVDQETPARVFYDHTDEVLALAFGPDGNILVSSGKDNTIRFWDITTGLSIGQPNPTRSNVPTLQFSPDGSTLAIAGENGRIQLCDPITGDPLITLRESGSPVLKLQFRSEGKILDVVGRDGNLVTFDLTSTDPQQQVAPQVPLPAAQGGITSIALSLDGSQAAYFHDGGTGDTALLSNDGRAHGIDISFWDQSFDPNVNRDDIDFVIIKATEGSDYVDPKFEEYVKLIQSVPMRGTYHFFRENEPWKEQADHFLATVKDKGFHFYILDLEVAPKDGSTDLRANAELWLSYVDERVEGKVLLETGTPILNQFGVEAQGLNDWPLMLIQYSFTPDRNGDPSLPTGFQDWKIWNYSENGNGAEYGVGTDNIFLVVYNGTPAEMGQWLGINAFSILDRTSNTVTNPKQSMQVTSSNGIAFSPDGSYIAVADANSVKLLDARTGDEISTLIVGGQSVFSLNFTQDSNLVAIGTDNGTVLLWSLSLLRLDTAAQPILDVACSQVKQNLSRDQWNQFVGLDVPYVPTCPNLPAP